MPAAAALLPWLSGLSTTTKIAGGLTIYELVRQIFGQASSMREAGVEKHGINLQKQMAESQLESNKMSTKDSRSAAREYMAQLMRMNEKSQERDREKEAASMAWQSRNNQMAILMEAMRMMSGAGAQTPLATGPQMGQSSFLRGSY